MTSNAFEQTILVDEGAGLMIAGIPHRVRLAPTIKTTHPTVILLHGLLGNEDVMWVFARTIPPEWLIVAPRAIFNLDSGYSWVTSQAGFPQLGAFAEAVSRLKQFIQSLPALYQADPNQIYLMGFSQGAAMSFALALSSPHLIKGIASLVGFMPDGGDECESSWCLENLPVFMAVGKQDETIPYQRSQATAQALLNTGAMLDYNEYDVGHRLHVHGFRDLKQWWTQFTKID